MFEVDTLYRVQSFPQIGSCLKTKQGIVILFLVVLLVHEVADKKDYFTAPIILFKKHRDFEEGSKEKGDDRQGKGESQEETK